MNSIKLMAATAALAVALPLASSAKTVKLRADGSNIAELVACMTVEEKARLLVGTGIKGLSEASFIGNAQNLVAGAAGERQLINRVCAAFHKLGKKVPSPLPRPTLPPSTRQPTSG